MPRILVYTCLLMIGFFASQCKRHYNEDLKHLVDVPTIKHSLSYSGDTIVCKVALTAKEIVRTDFQDYFLNQVAYNLISKDFDFTTIKYVASCSDEKTIEKEVVTYVSRETAEYLHKQLLTFPVEYELQRYLMNEMSRRNFYLYDELTYIFIDKDTSEVNFGNSTVPLAWKRVLKSKINSPEHTFANYCFTYVNACRTGEIDVDSIATLFTTLKIAALSKEPDFDHSDLDYIDSMCNRNPGRYQ